MLRLLHHFYLMGAGDFYLEFISRVDYGLLHSPAEISDGWLQDEFNHCVHNTSLSASYSFISQHVRLQTCESSYCIGYVETTIHLYRMWTQSKRPLWTCCNDKIWTYFHHFDDLKNPVTWNGTIVDGALFFGTRIRYTERSGNQTVVTTCNGPF